MIGESQVYFAIIFAIPLAVAFLVGYVVKLINKKPFDYRISATVFWTLAVVEFLWMFDVI